MSMLNISLKGAVLEVIERTRAGMKSADGLMKILAKRAKDVYVAHFRQKNTIPNKMGWPAQGVWARIARATTVAYVFEDRLGLSIADPIINQKVHGGPITPKNGHALAIPATAEAYVAGSPREGGTPPLKLEMYLNASGQKRAMLVAEDNYQKVNKKGDLKRVKGQALAGATHGRGQVWYWLVWGIKRQDPDPTALPPDDIVLNMMLATAREVASELMRREALAKG